MQPATKSRLKRTPHSFNALSAVEQLEAEELESQAVYYTWALGPSGITPGTTFHMDLIYSGMSGGINEAFA